MSTYTLKILWVENGECLTESQATIAKVVVVESSAIGGWRVQCSDGTLHFFPAAAHFTLTPEV